MSINMLANAAAARRTDIGPNTAPSTMSEIAAAATTSPEKASAQPQTASGITTALNVLFGYIPTEIVTLYVAVSTALQPQKISDGASANFNLNSQWIAFWCFLAAAPAAVWVIYATKIKAVGKPVPVNYSAWPIMGDGCGPYCILRMGIRPPKFTLWLQVSRMVLSGLGEYHRAPGIFSSRSCRATFPESP